MKIAYAGDWHANTQWAVKAIEYARENGAEHIIHLGDYGYDFRPSFRNDVELALAQAHIKLWFVDGNHEDFNWLYKQPVNESGLRKISEHVYHMPRGFRWEWEDVKFLAVGGAYSVDRRWRKLNESWWAEEVITDEQVQEAIKGGPADVLISHDCPAGVEIPGLESTSKMFPPLEILRSNEHQMLLNKIANVVQPKVIWHGHYHRRYSTVANLGYAYVEVHGLDMDATNLKDNVVIVDL
jgi:predicted phosphodiesterase